MSPRYKVLTQNPGKLIAELTSDISKFLTQAQVDSAINNVINYKVDFDLPPSKGTSTFDTTSNVGGYLAIRDSEFKTRNSLVSMYSTGLDNTWSVEYVNATNDSGVVRNIDNKLSSRIPSLDQNGKENLMCVLPSADVGLTYVFSVKSQTNPSATFMWNVSPTETGYEYQYLDYASGTQVANQSTVAASTSNTFTVGDEYTIHIAKIGTDILVYTDSGDQSADQLGIFNANALSTFGLLANPNAEIRGMEFDVSPFSIGSTLKDTEKLTNLFIVGDAVVDGGKNYELITDNGGYWNDTLYPQGRYTNGLSFGDYIATALGFDASDVKNVAQGDARLTKDIDLQDQNDPPANVVNSTTNNIVQIESYLSQVTNGITNGYITANTLVFVSGIGGNDLLAYIMGDYGDLETNPVGATTAFIAAMITGFESIVNALLTALVPAKNIIMCNSNLYHLIRQFLEKSVTDGTIEGLLPFNEMAKKINDGITRFLADHKDITLINFYDMSSEGMLKSIINNGISGTIMDTVHPYSQLYHVGSFRAMNEILATKLLATNHFPYTKYTDEDFFTKLMDALGINVADRDTELQISIDRQFIDTLTQTPRNATQDDKDYYEAYKTLVNGQRHLIDFDISISLEESTFTETFTAPNVASLASALIEIVGNTALAAANSQKSPPSTSLTTYTITGTNAESLNKTELMLYSSLTTAQKEAWNQFFESIGQPELTEFTWNAKFGLLDMFNKNFIAGGVATKVIYVNTNI